MPEEDVTVSEDELQRRREWFDAYFKTIDWPTPPDFTAPLKQFTCPCCGYPTLTQRGGFEMCPLCIWEDDGQDDPHANEVWGGPNAGYSLTQARENFKKFWTMYEPDPYSSPESQVELAAKQEIARAFDAMRIASDEAERQVLLNVVRENLETLQCERDRAEHEFEERSV